MDGGASSRVRCALAVVVPFMAGYWLALQLAFVYKDRFVHTGKYKGMYLRRNEGKRN